MVHCAYQFHPQGRARYLLEQSKSLDGCRPSFAKALAWPGSSRRSIMSLMPYYCVFYNNGVYYYDCLDCSTPQPYVHTGAQDTRQHQMGVACGNILDPILEIHHPPPIHHDSAPAAAVDLRVINAIAPYPIWSPPWNKGISCTNDPWAHSAYGVTVDHHDTQTLTAEFNLNNTPRKVRLFNICFSWINTDPKTQAQSIQKGIMRVGQELENPTEQGQMQGTGHTPVRCGLDNKFYRITVTEKAPRGAMGVALGDYYVLLK